MNFSDGGENIRYTIYRSDVVGQLFIASTSRGICRIDFDGGDEEEFVRRINEKYNGQVLRDDGFFHDLKETLDSYFAGERVEFQFPLDLTSGTAFQRKVWAELQKIPYGQVRSYKEIARAIAMPKAWRAVGRACGTNPVAILVPCHRVITNNGRLGGYSSGVNIKKRLLKLEGVTLQ